MEGQEEERESSSISLKMDSCLQLAKQVGMRECLNGSNLALSPISIHVALCFVAAGCEGRTLEQLLSFLKSPSVEELNSLCSRLAHSVRNSTVWEEGGGPLLLSFVNGIWIDKIVALKPSFKEKANAVYKAQADVVDFIHQPKKSAAQVNAWIERGTNGLIKDLIPVDSVDEKTRIILGNALYFKGTWNDPFPKFLTTESPFYLFNGTSVRVPFMSTFMNQFISSFDGFKVLKLPYKPGNDERRFYMYIFLPDQIDGLPGLIEKMGSDTGFLDRHLPNRRVRLRKFMVPRFKISFRFEATEMLNRLGVLSLFSPIEAELTGMVVEGSSLGGRLHVSSIHHSSFIEVNEEGTEAAAATMVVGEAQCGFRSTAMDFVADHPFMFMVREDVNGVVLFTGHVLNPSTVG